MTLFKAWTTVEGQMAEFTFQAENVYEAWEFAVRNFYPKGSTRQLRVSEAASDALTPLQSWAATTYSHRATFTA